MTSSSTNDQGIELIARTHCNVPAGVYSAAIGCIGWAMAVRRSYSTYEQHRVQLFGRLFEFRQIALYHGHIIGIAGVLQILL